MAADGSVNVALPPVPPDIDLRSHCWMKLDLCRLHSSDFIHLATNEEFGAAVKLWTEAMRQVPAGSLPDDDKILASLAGYRGSGRRWQKIRPMALHGFTLCSDGRLYHPVLAEMALDAWACKAQQPPVNLSDPRARDRERLRRWRAEQRAKKQTAPEAQVQAVQGLGGQGMEPAETFQRRFSETFPETDETLQGNREETEKEREEKHDDVSDTSPETLPETAPPQHAEAPSPTREGLLCKQLRDLGVRAAPHMIVVQEMCAEHTDEHILAAAAIALEKKGAGIHVGYIAAMLKNGAGKGKTGKNHSTAGPPNRQLLPPVAVGAAHYVKL